MGLERKHGHLSSLPSQGLQAVLGCQPCSPGHAPYGSSVNPTAKGGGSGSSVLCRCYHKRCPNSKMFWFSTPTPSFGLARDERKFVDGSRRQSGCGGQYRVCGGGGLGCERFACSGAPPYLGITNRSPLGS